MAAGPKPRAQPDVSDGPPPMTIGSHGKVPSPSTSTANWPTPLEVPGRPSMSGSAAVSARDTFRSFVAAAPPSITTVPVGGVASIIVSRVVSTVPAPKSHAACWHAPTATRRGRPLPTKIGPSVVCVPAENVCGLPSGSGVTRTS